MYHPQHITLNSNQLIVGMLLSALMALGYIIYIPGLTGVFLLDDFHNLSTIGRYSYLSYWDNFWLFLLEGDSGPTGRPLSLASFFINTNTWPSQPSRFIQTNIIIHLTNGILIYWVSFKLSKLLTSSQSQQTIFPLLITALWVLNPMHTTTVLYIIQRMTELSATFMLVGILCYLYGREQLIHKPFTGFITLFIGFGLSLLLAILSKENGILLVAYILVIEFFLLQPFKNPPPKRFNYWFIPAVVLPFLFILIYLGNHISPDGFHRRNFTLSERLLTEPRILFDYLYQLLMPKMGYSTLFHDDYLISKDFFSPWTTLPAIIGILFLLGLSIFLRKRIPIIAFAIMWFFAGHLIESTVIALELYFEHRNYLPSLGILFPIAWYTSKFMVSHKNSILLFVAGLLVLYSFITFQNATQWGKPLELSYGWHKNHPSSERARNTYQSIAINKGIKPLLIAID